MAVQLGGGDGLGAQQVVAGDEHTCVLFVSQQVKCWGVNSAGQLGVGDYAHRGDQVGEMGDALPFVNIFGGVLHVSAGGGVTCAVSAFFETWCWGSNSRGQLGVAVGGGSAVPLRVELGDGDTSSVLRVAVASSKVCALLMQRRSVKCWGAGVPQPQLVTPAQAPLPVGAIAVNVVTGHSTATSTSHCVVYVASAAALHSGGSSSSALGAACFDGAAVAAFPVGSITAVVGGGSQLCRVDRVDGGGESVACTGISLVNANTTLSTGAVVTTGGYDTCAAVENGVRCFRDELLVRTDGRAPVWKDGATQCAYDAAYTRGTLGGVRAAEPVCSRLTRAASGTRTRAAVAVGVSHVCAIVQARVYVGVSDSDGGQVLCWGSTSNGVLGVVATGSVPVSRATWVPLGPKESAVEVKTGGHFTCALLAGSAQLKCWGLNLVGQVGAGLSRTLVEVPLLEPVDLGGGGALHVQEYALGWQHACAILSDGGVKCWGSNTNGQLGLPMATSSAGTTPGSMGDALAYVRFPRRGAALAVACGERHSCAIADEARVYCWGSGQFAGVTAIAALDAAVAPPAQVLASGDLSCVQRAGFSVSCWSGGALAPTAVTNMGEYTDLVARAGAGAAAGMCGVLRSGAAGSVYCFSSTSASPVVAVTTSMAHYGGVAAGALGTCVLAAASSLTSARLEIQCAPESALLNSSAFQSLPLLDVYVHAGSVRRADCMLTLC